MTFASARELKARSKPLLTNVISEVESAFSNSPNNNVASHGEGSRDQGVNLLFCSDPSPLGFRAKDGVEDHGFRATARRQFSLWLLALLLSVGSVHALVVELSTSISAILVLGLLFPTIIGIWFDVSVSLAALVLPKRLLLRVDTDDGALTCLVEHDVPLVIPVLVRDLNDVADALASARENHLLAADPRIGVVLLIDFGDADSPTSSEDAVLREALANGVARLNASLDADQQPVEMLVRQRQWNDFDGIWMGWERKRGKLVEFMRLTRGLKTSYDNRCPARWKSCPLMITIDVDTRLERQSVGRLVAAYSRCVARSDVIGPPPAILTPVLETLESPVEPLARWLTEPAFYRSSLDPREPKPSQLVFGRDLFNGKGLIAIDQFLQEMGSIPVNTVLSHDHLEAMLVGACAIDSVSVFEPFPKSRDDWERRQHRWIRGDTQVLPWATSGCSGHASRSASPLPLHCRLVLVRIAGGGVGLILRYLAVVALAIEEPVLAFLVAIGSSLCARDGAVHGILLFARSKLNGYKGGAGATGFGYFVLNGFLRSLGDLIYLQRNVLVTADATSLTLLRMARGRRGLLEWHPAKAERVLSVRRWCEMTLLAIASIFAFNGSLAAAALVIIWIAVPAAISLIGDVPNPGLKLRTAALVSAV